jgi:membrane associated rhomboid family serine protease
MREFSIGAMQLEACTNCQLLWFDAGELQAQPAPDTGPPSDPKLHLPKDVRVQLALLKADVQRRELEGESPAIPDPPWKLVPLVLGMPVELDKTFTKRSPLVTWASAILIMVASLLAFLDLDRAVDLFGFIPALALRHSGATFFTATLVHAGFRHLVGNLYFLMAFGDDLEERLGSKRFGLLLALATVGGFLTHKLVHPTAMVPVIGASGAISGVIAYYALRFRSARLSAMFFSRFVQMPAWFAGLLWIGMQIAGAIISDSLATSGIAYWVHIGGAAVGAAYWVVKR